MLQSQFHVSFNDEEDCFIGRIDRFPYLVSKGETEEEALENIKNKVAEYLKEHPEEQK